MKMNIKADVTIDTDNRQVVFNISDHDAKVLASQLHEIIMKGNGIPGIRNLVAKTLVEGKIMNWVRSLIAMGWVDVWRDGDNWRVTVKRGGL